MRNLIRFGIALIVIMCASPILLVVMAVIGFGPGLIQSGLMSGGVFGLVLIVIGAGITYGMFRMAMGVKNIIQNR